MSDHAWVRNPVTDGVWACPVDYLPVALARGWEAYDPPVEDEVPEVPAPPVTRARARKAVAE